MAESDLGSNVQEVLTREMRAHLAAITGGLAPDDYAQAWWDWYLNIAQTPGKQTAIAQTAFEGVVDNLVFAMRASTGQPVAPAVDDKRFASESWNQWPFNVLARGYVNWEHAVKQATSDLPGLSRRSADLVAFSSRQILEAASPANYLLANPELLEITRAQSGKNLVDGFKNWLEDIDATLKHKPPAGSEAFKVGENVAVTPGKIVYRNELIELIQYGATTDSVHPEPVLIVPAWIMKYYILDLSPRNSLVRYLVGKGHTVFMISWKNPNETDRNLGMDDYHNRGVREALNVVNAIVPQANVHGVGYCIGGTLLSIAAAELGRVKDHRLASMTLFAAQTDFSEPGELSLFISPSQLSMLEAVMHKAGVLSSDKMGASFALLRARDLLWAPAINTYVKGSREKLNDLMAWNSDGTRMPCRMHTEYLKQLYLQNDLAGGRFRVNGEMINLAAITVPTFTLGTETDHVAPWRSTYKTRALTRSADYTFLLTSGGHNGGIVSGPVNPKRRYRELTWKDTTSGYEPEQWLERSNLHPGSWWPFWQNWLAAHSGPPDAPLPTLGCKAAGFDVLGDAPGQYVLQK
ncbi:MAG: alpha/beta fold hydrolase [Pseudomonadota bacterium]|nr:alpha/beta fold hydrolase [Pseudomonadota bacterium]